MPSETEDLYGETEPAMPQEEATGGEAESTAILPKSFFPDPDLAPGKRCEVEIVRVNEADVEVKYSKSAQRDYPEQEPVAAPIADDMSEMMG